VTTPKGGVESDDPVADWGPDAGRGLFDPSETTATGEVSGYEGTGSLAAEDAGGAERPVAVLAWIAATLDVAPGAARGDVPALRSLVANEPLDLLPGGFRPTRVAYAPGGLGAATSAIETTEHTEVAIPKNEATRYDVRRFWAIAIGVVAAFGLIGLAMKAWLR
jgi:hypothetical protein